MNVKTGLLLILIGGLAGTACAACKISQEADNWVLENDLIRVTLRPDVQGIVDDFRLKSDKLLTIRPFTETRTEIVPGTGVYGMAQSPHGGCRDALWPGGLETFKGPYTFSIVEKSADKIRVRLVLDQPSWRAEREFTMTDGCASLDAVVRLTSRAEKELPGRAYWFQCFLRLADTLLSMPGDDSEVLLLPVRQESKPIRDLTRPMKQAKVFVHSPEETQDMYLAPGQPWMGAIDRTQKLFFGVHFDMPEFPADMFYYSWSDHANDYSMEAIFPQRTFLPGKPVEHKFRLIALRGLPDVHLLRPEYAVYLNRGSLDKISRTTPVKWTLGVVSPRAGSSLVLRVTLNNVTSEPIRLTGLSPDRPVFAPVNVPLEKLSPGVYEIQIEQEGKGKFSLLGQTITIY